jgi:hypothetical protein
MADHVDNGLRAVIKALNDVIMPAIDAQNALAIEQARLVTKYLEFVRSRLPFYHERASFELSHYLGLATRLTRFSSVLPPEIALALGSSVERGQSISQTPSVSMEEIGAASAALSASISAAVRSAASRSEDHHREIETIVLAASREYLDAQRAWYIPMGFELDLAEVRDLAEALTQARQESG